jgi:hypothetical protein
MSQKRRSVFKIDGYGFPTGGNGIPWVTGCLYPSFAISMTTETRVSSADMAALLGISVKTLHRHRKSNTSFWRPGIHYSLRTPGVTELVWDAEKTQKAWLVSTRPGLN